MTDKQIGYGSTIERKAPGDPDFTKIPRAKVAPVPKSEADYVDVTDLDSPGGYKEYLPGLKDAGEVEFSAHYTRAGYQQQAADEGSRALIEYRTTFANGDVFTFAGYPSVSVDPAEAGAAREMMVKIRISGAVSFTAGGA